MARRKFYSRSTRRTYRRSKLGKGLTGGTGDINPQWLDLLPLTPSDLTAAATTPAASSVNALVVGRATPIPIQAMPAKAGAALVLEILAVKFTQNATAANTGTGVAFVSTKNLSPSLSASIDLPTKTNVLAAAEIGVVAAKNTVVDLDYNNFPMNDGAGHGIIVASQNLYLCYSADVVESNANRSIYAKVLYRWKYVTLMEYVGLVTSLCQ